MDTKDNYDLCDFIDWYDGGWAFGAATPEGEGAKKPKPFCEERLHAQAHFSSHNHGNQTNHLNQSPES
jgi:hypothetical protein